MDARNTIPNAPGIFTVVAGIVKKWSGIVWEDMNTRLLPYGQDVLSTWPEDGIFKSVTGPPGEGTIPPVPLFWNGSSWQVWD